MFRLLFVSFLLCATAFAVGSHKLLSTRKVSPPGFVFTGVRAHVETSMTFTLFLKQDPNGLQVCLLNVLKFGIWLLCEYFLSGVKLFML